MEAWRSTFRDGVAPQLSTPGLKALAKALKEDDERLLQGATTSPPPLACVQDWPVEAACPIAFAHWQGDGTEFVGPTEEMFAKTCFETDQLLGEPAAVRFFLNWADNTPREEMRSELLAEVTRILTIRRIGEEAEPNLTRGTKQKERTRG